MQLKIISTLKVYKTSMPAIVLYNREFGHGAIEFKFFMTNDCINSFKPQKKLRNLTRNVQGY
jgi:hypothetical protein